MKGLYILLFFIFIQTCLNSSDLAIIIPEESGFGQIDCTQNSYYGFYFLAEVSGFKAESHLSFFCEAPYYINFNCTIPPENEDGQVQYVYCYGLPQIFPLLDDSNVVKLPQNLKFNKVDLVGWEYVAKNELNFGFCSPLVPTNTFISTKAFTATCDKDDNNVLSTTGTFEDNASKTKIFLTSTDETVYSFKPYLIVDGELAYALCKIYLNNEENGGDDKLECTVDGKENGVFFDSASALELVEGSSQGVVRLKAKQAFNLKVCKSSFISLSALLFISLFLL